MEPNGYQFPQIVISSGEKGVWPDGNAFGVVLSGERQVWPDGRSQQTRLSSRAISAKLK